MPPIFRLGPLGGAQIPLKNDLKKVLKKTTQKRLWGSMGSLRERPGAPTKPKREPKGSQKGIKKRVFSSQHGKTRNLTKTLYLLCFKHILALASALKMCFFLPKSCPGCPGRLLATRVSLISLWGGISRPSWGLLDSPLVSQGLPRVSKKSPKNHPKSLLKPGLPVGCPRHAPRLPHRP